MSNSKSISINDIVRIDFSDIHVYGQIVKKSIQSSPHETYYVYAVKFKSGNIYHFIENDLIKSSIEEMAADLL